MHARLNPRRTAGLVATATALMLGLALAPSAGATVQLQPSASPLPGSSFQGGDGNQTPANSTTKLDWKDFKSDPELKTLVDPSNPDREFGGGSSEDKPDTWTFSDPAESTPLKANFRVAWDLFKSNPGRLLQLAFRRAVNGGNAFLAFELNQDPKMWTNSVGTSIPCRTTGDLLITYNVANSDATEIYLTVQKWTSTTSDAASGCAKTGTLTQLPDSALTDGVNVQGAVNNATSNALSPELPSPPGGLPNNEKGAIPSEMESGLSCGSAQNWICGGLFGETAIDLPSVFSRYQENPCFSFGSVWAHGRSSISQSSALQDYVSPSLIAIRSCTASGFKFNDLNANGTWDKPAEPAVQGWKVWLDRNKDGKVDSDETATTNATGEYVFTGLSAGTYAIKELAASEQTGDLQKLDVCSYPDSCSSGYSITIDSSNLTSSGNTFGNYANPRLELVKSLKPSDDPGLFNLSASQTSGGSGSISSTDSGDGEGTGPKTVTPGTWKLGETGGTGTALSDYSGDLACATRASGGAVAVTESSIGLAPGDDVVCTFTNTRNTGTITVEKSLSPSDDAGLFDLLIGGTAYATDVGDGGTTGKQTLNTGSYSIEEAAGTGTSLDDYATKLACQDQEGSVTVDEGKVSLGSGQDITCLFANTRETGTIKLVKSLSPADDSGLFDLLLDGSTKAANVGNGGASDTLTVNTGSHTVSEVAGTGTSLADYTSSASCEAGGQVIASGAVTTLSVSVTNEQAVTCTFSNVRNPVPPPPNGTIIITKNTTDGSPGSFGFGGDLGSFSLTSGSSTTFSQPAGTYSVTESPASGFALSSLVCSDAGDASGSSSISGSTALISLQAGETVVCTWTNAPAGGVLPAIAGSARVSGSQGCVTGRYAYVRVRGANIQRVTYFVSGKRVKTLTERNSRGRYFELRYPVRNINPGSSKRVTASVLYVDGASPASTSLRWRIVRCAAKKPSFTG